MQDVMWGEDIWGFWKSDEQKVGINGVEFCYDCMGRYFTEIACDAPHMQS